MIRLLTGCDFPEVETYLTRNCMETALFYGNLARCGLENDRLSRRAGDYYGYFLEGRLKGILAFYNLGNVVAHFENAAASDSFVEIMQQRRFEMVVGLKKVIESLRVKLAPYKSMQDCEESYFLVNRMDKPYSSAFAHQVVDVEKLERPVALSFIVEAYRLGFHRRFNQELAVRLVEEREQGEAFVFLVIDNMPVAQAVIQVVTDRTAQIGGVYTRECHRGKGYCKALVAELCRRIYASGKIPTLLVRKNNIPAVRVYHSLGFTYYDEYLIAKFKV